MLGGHELVCTGLLGPPAGVLRSTHPTSPIRWPPAHRIQAADFFHDFLPWQSIAAEQIGDVTEKWRFQRSVQKASQNHRDLWKTAQPARRADDDVIEALAANRSNQALDVRVLPR